MTRRLVYLIALALLLVACTEASVETTTSIGADPTTAVDPEPTTTSDPPTTTTSLPEPTWDELPGIETLPPEVQEELLALVRSTEELRQLRFLEAPLIDVVTEQELETRVREQIEEESADFPPDEALYKLLGLLDEAVDLETLLTDLYGEQVAGFYEGETGELVVPIRDEGFSIVQKATLIHELTHSLTDQHFRFDDIFQTMIDEERLDQASAYQALIEGDASMTELLYLQTLSQRELGEFLAEALDIDREALDAAPMFIQDSLIFPYDSGLAFVQQHYMRDGWETVSEAYSVLPDLPGSTEQIITPSDYQRDLPEPVETTAPSLTGYDLERESVWGELGFRIMLDQILGEETGVEAADGWGGDSYAQWFDGENAALLVQFVGDTERDLEELRSALVDYALAAVAEEDYVWVEVIDGRLAFIAADQPEVGQSILASVGG